MKITLFSGDLFSVSCDALVNPTDASLSGAGGLDRQIQHRGGPQLQAQCRALAGSLQSTQVGVTDPGSLHCRHVFHLVSPRRSEETGEEFALLRQSMTNLLRAAVKHRARRIAVPLFATGAGGYDPAGETWSTSGISRYALTLLCAVADFPTVYRHDSHQQEVIFVCSSPEKYAILEKAHRWLFGKGVSTRSRIHGSLLGGALGDALGYPVEFRDHAASRISELTVDEASGTALISDDTQMTLFTACGLLFGVSRGMMKGIGGNPHCYIRYAYGDWYKTQSPKAQVTTPSVSWIRNIPQLNVRRAPGNTCLTALNQGGGSMEEPINHSKGCGGVMRIAPLPLYMAGNHRGSREQAVLECARTAAITHGHPLGWLSAGALGGILYDLMLNYSLEYAVKNTVLRLPRQFSQYPQAVRMAQLLEKAMELGRTAQTLQSEDLIRDCNVTAHLGEGWVGEEALAIGLFAVVATRNGSMEDCLRCAVGHRGDSDSTGSIAGQIRGAMMGREDLPINWLQKLELRQVIQEIAEDLTNDCQMHEYSLYHDAAWVRKYLSMENSSYIPHPGEEKPLQSLQLPFLAQPEQGISIPVTGIQGQPVGTYTLSLQGEDILRSAATEGLAHAGALGFGVAAKPSYDPGTGLYTERAGWVRILDGGGVRCWFNSCTYTLLPNYASHTVEIFGDLDPTPWLGSARRSGDWGNPMEFRLRQSQNDVPCHVIALVIQMLLQDVLEEGL